MRTPLLVSFALVASCLLASNVVAGPSLNGYTGLIIAPTARVTALD